VGDRTRGGESEACRGDRVSSRNQITGTVFGPSVQAGTIRGDVNIHVAAPEQVHVPAQLLPCPPYFTGREPELSLLSRLAERTVDHGPPQLIVISGAGGIGKTSLGLCWLHQIRNSYTDGQLFMDLRGLTGAPPMRPSEPLERFLRALGVPPERVPADVEEQAALYRSRTAGRRLIIMLDNAASAAQVRPLLPGHGPTLVLVTTRWRLSGLALEGASFVSLHPLDEAGAIRLLDRMLGQERTDAEPDAARSLIALCGRLPLALCTSAARLAVRDRWQIARLVAELADEQRRLSVLSAEEGTSVQAVFDLSYHGLPTDAARLYRMLGMHPGIDFDVAAAAALAGLPPDEVAPLLDLLVGAHLLEETLDDRFAFHDLIRLHAHGILEREESTPARDAAFGRLLDYYLATAVAADLTVIPGRPRIGLYYKEEPRVSFADAAAAINWLEAELANITAIQKAARDRKLHDAAWEICEALWGLFVYRKHYHIWLETHEIGLASARSDDNLKAQALILESLATAYLNLQNFSAALRCCDEALQLERATAHLSGEGMALERIGVARLGLHDFDDAVAAFNQALDIYEHLGHKRGTALMRRQLGVAFRRSGRFTEALEQLAHAHQTFVDLHERYNEARTLSGIAETYVASGRLEEAEQAFAKALAEYTEIGAVHAQADALTAMARLARRLGQPAVERAIWRKHCGFTRSSVHRRRATSPITWRGVLHKWGPMTEMIRPHDARSRSAAGSTATVTYASARADRCRPDVRQIYASDAYHPTTRVALQ
jgi:tetratricopeptide (TPR) repeat protein